MTITENQENAANPVLAEVFRKDIVESRHRGSVIVMDDAGLTVLSLGNTSSRIYPRSAIKYFQSIPLVESGAAAHFNLSTRELAMSCASHIAEDVHLETVSTWLERIGLGIDDLENGPDYPLSEEVRNRMIRNGEGPSSLHQNCSGKHAGMLTLAKFLGESTRGYSEHDHPAQLAWMQALSDLVGVDVPSLDWELDGCGMPAICIPMEAMAFGCALYAKPDRVGGTRQAAMEKIMSAVRSEPRYIRGAGRCCTRVIEVSRGDVVVKTGAEAVYTGILPNLGYGFCIKIDDGCGRGSEVALGALLDVLGALDENRKTELDDYFRPAILNSQGRQTGWVLPGPVWKDLR